MLERFGIGPILGFIVIAIGALHLIGILRNTIPAQNVWSSMTVAIILILIVLILTTINEFKNLGKVYAAVSISLAVAIAVIASTAMYYAIIYIQGL